VSDRWCWAEWGVPAVMVLDPLLTFQFEEELMGDVARRGIDEPSADCGLLAGWPLFLQYYERPRAPLFAQRQ